MANLKLDRSAPRAKHGDGEHEQAGIIERGHHVDAVDDQVTPGTEDQGHKTICAHSFGPYFLHCSSMRMSCWFRVQSHLIRGYIIPVFMTT